jgi:RNA polymerase-binding transcription factor DksA
MSSDLNLTDLKLKLEAEKAELEAELAKVGRPNPQNPSEWEVTPAPEGEAEFREEVADHLEEMAERTETDHALNNRHREVVAALARLTSGSYGRCAVCNEPIEAERLAANPAAQVCKAHI